MGFGALAEPSRMRLPSPPQKSTTFMKSITQAVSERLALALASAADDLTLTDGRVLE